MPRSAREIDLDPRTYVGLSFPLRADNNNNFAMTKNSIQQSKHNLRNLLLTYPGERAGNPEFGCRLRELCFEQHNESLPSRIETEIVEATNQFLPYIKTLTDANQQEKIFVSIKFSTTLDPQVNQALTLDVGEATEVGDSTGGSTSGRPGGY
jgi:phage baseplate assembly protein W